MHAGLHICTRMHGCMEPFFLVARYQNFLKEISMFCRVRRLQRCNFHQLSPSRSLTNPPPSLPIPRVCVCRVAAHEYIQTHSTDPATDIAAPADKMLSEFFFFFFSYGSI